MRAAQRHRQRRRALGLVAVDDDRDPAVRQPGIDGVEQGRRRGDDRRIAPVAGIAVHLVEQPVHRRALVGVELDPQSRCGDLLFESFGRRRNQHPVGNAQPGCVDGAGGAVERELAVAGNQDGRRIKAGGAGARAAHIGIHFGQAFQQDWPSNLG